MVSGALRRAQPSTSQPTSQPASEPANQPAMPVSEWVVLLVVAVAASNFIKFEGLFPIVQKAQLSGIASITRSKKKKKLKKEKNEKEHIFCNC